VQLQESGFSEWFAFEPHFFVMDCRVSRDREMDRLKTTLAACHKALSLQPTAVPKICSKLLDKLQNMRKDQENEPIVTVEELLRTATDSADLLLPVCDSICR
jgi:hypothetical protein